LKISSQALDKGLSRAWAWLGLGFLGLGLAGLGLSGLACPSLIQMKGNNLVYYLDEVIQARE
jgi:hypothetical protein